MQLIHGQILAKILRVSKEDPFDSKLPENYSGSIHKSYKISTSQLYDIVKDVISSSKESPANIKKSVLSLYKGESSEEKYAASRILQKYKDVRDLVTPSDVDQYLNFLTGWAEIDSLCQLVFDFEDMERDWDGWSDMLVKLSKDRNISKRRASIVLLVKPVSHSSDEKYAKLAFENINRLKFEREILITKAISWMLRSMVKNFRDKVESYLVRNFKSLPSIAVRETRIKLTTGRKKYYPIEK